MGCLQQIIALVHLYAQRLQGLHHLVHIGDDRLVGILRTLHLCQEMLHYGVVQTELHLLGIHHHQLQFSGMLLVQKRCEYDVQSH